MSGKKCQPNCQCRKHSRSKYHNFLIGEGVRLTNARKRAYQPRNQISDRFEPR